MAEELLLAIGEGRLSISSAARIAEARMAEPSPDADTAALAACAASEGKNAERTLHRWVERQPWRKLLPQPYAFKAPLQRNGVRYNGVLSCMLPHEVFSCLAKQPEAFKQLFGASEELEDFWEAVLTSARGRAWLANHPGLLAAAATRRVPIGIHGDEGEMRGKEKVLVLSWGGVCRRGSTLDTRLLFAVLKAAECCPGRATWFAAFHVWQWSLAALASGKHPRADEHGRPFKDPARKALAGKQLVEGDQPTVGAWVELRGDWEFLRDSLGLQDHFGSTRICHLCQATKNTGGPLDYNRDFGPEAATRDTLLPAHAPAGAPRAQRPQIRGPRGRRAPAHATSPLLQDPWL